MATCDYYSQVDQENREPLIEYDDEKRERELICNLLYSTSCSAEQKRFNALSIWTEKYIRPDSGDSLIDYLDGLIYAADNLNLDDLYDSGYISLTYSDTVFFKSLKNGYGQSDLSSLGDSLSLINSNLISLKAQLDYDSNEDRVIFSQLTININEEFSNPYIVDLTDLSFPNM